MTLNADLYIIQECENPDRILDIYSDEFYDLGLKYIWKGENKSKGIGVFSKYSSLTSLENMESNELKYFIPFSINNELKFLAAWCHGKVDDDYRHIGQLWKYLQLHKNELTYFYIIGDLNSNAIQDKEHPGCSHSDVVNELAEIGLYSFYHYFEDIRPGNENESTFYLYRKLERNYHIDYLFGTLANIKRCSEFGIGKYTDWIEISDHMPIYAVINENS